MELRDDIKKWVETWGFSVSQTELALVKAKSFCCGEINEYAAMMILALATAKAHNIDSTAVRLATKQLLNIIHKKLV